MITDREIERDRTRADRKMVGAMQRDFPPIVERLVEITQLLTTHPNAQHHIDRDQHLADMREMYQGLTRCIDAPDPYTGKVLLERWVGRLSLWANVVGVRVWLYWHDSTHHLTGVYRYSSVDLMESDYPIRNIANTRLDKRWLHRQIDNGRLGNIPTQPGRVLYPGKSPDGRKRIRRR